MGTNSNVFGLQILMEKESAISLFSSGNKRSTVMETTGNNCYDAFYMNQKYL